MQKSNEKKVLALSAIAVITLIAVIIGATYAYFQAQGGGSSDIDASVITSTTDKLSFQVGNGINISASQENFAQGLGNRTGSTTASAMLTANNATNTATRNYNLYLDIKNNGFTYTVDENTPELILTITGPDDQPLEDLAGYEYVTVDGVSGFDITEASNAILIADNYEITASPEVTQTWNITVTFINLDSDQNKNTGKTFAADVIIGEEKLAATSNWMYMGLWEWTISRISSSTNYAFSVYSAGYVIGDNRVTVTPAVRPVFYLSSNVAYAGGTGEINSPIRLSL